MGEDYKATSISNAYERLAGDEHSEVNPGGQTLMLLLQEGLKDPDLLVDISEINAFQELVDDGDVVRIGSGVTYSELLERDVLESAFPFFSDALTQISGLQVRNHGTIGVGLCYGDPALDTPPVLLVLDAELVLRDGEEEQRLSLTEFYTGYYATALDSGEILTWIVVPKLPSRSAGTYRTMTPRQGDCALAGVAVRLALDDGGVCETARVALANAGETPTRARSSESALEGTELTLEAVDKAVSLLDRDLDLLGVEQTSRTYKDTVFKRLTRQAVVEVRDESGGDE